MPDIDIAAGWQWCVDQCNDPTVAYSRPNRNAGRDAYGNTYYDCSSLMNYTCIHMGFETPNHAPYSNPWVTQDMPSELARLGWHQIGNAEYLLPGDIGVDVVSHTEMVYSEGYLGQSAIWMGAHSDKYPWEQQVSIDSKASDHTSWEQIWRYEDGWTGEPTAKFSFEVCAAICGNFYQESGCNPGVWESLVVRPWDWQYVYDNTGGYGLGQWTNVGSSHGRCYNLYSFMTSNGYDVDNGDGQLDFMVNNECYWKGAKDKEGLWAFLQSTSTDLEALTEEFMHYWEGNYNTTLPQRYAAAQNAYSYIQDHWQDDVKWKSYNNYTSEADYLNNCVCVYQWLNLTVAGGTNAATGGGTSSSNNNGNASTQVGFEPNNWYELFLAMAGMCGNKDTAAEALRILRQRK